MASGLAGCNAESNLSTTENKTLSENLNKPVDVEKVRAEYAKEHPDEKTGAAPGGP